MTIPQIEAFLVLASTLNFTRASAILHTTQPNLSKIIVNLEQELGVQLLNRNKRDVKLTPAGEAFRKEMQAMMEQYRRAVDFTQEVHAGVKGSVSVGFLGTALMRQLPKVVARFRQEHPDISLSLADFTYSRLMEALTEDKIDVAILPERELKNQPRYEKRLVYVDDMCLVVHSSDPLAANDSIDLAEAKNHHFVIMDPKVSAGDYELVSDLCTDHGFIPQISYEANTLNSLVMLVECGVGVSILASHMAHFASPHVSFVKIRGCEKLFRVSCAWRAEANPCTQHFLKVLENELALR